VSETHDERDPVERLAEEFIERLRRGEDPSIEELANRYPEFADSIRELLPAMIAMEALGATRADEIDAPTARVAAGDSVGQYRIVRELGSGGMGTVYEAHDANGVRVAVKVVHPRLLAMEGFRERFLREAVVGKRIEHPNVIRLLDAGESAGRPYIALEFVVGQTLDALRRELGRVPETLCRHIGARAAHGLEAIHAEGIVHRDVKPANILITPDREVRVMDLGLARAASGIDRVTLTGRFVGSPAYCPPEQLLGSRVLDARGDLYSLGVTLYELATGERPFTGDSLVEMSLEIMDSQPPRPRDLCPELSPFFEGLLLSLLEKAPEHRVASARELAELLESAEPSA